jgi:hypothetical protein
MNAHLFAILDRVPAPTSAANDDEILDEILSRDLAPVEYAVMWVGALMLLIGVIFYFATGGVL